MGGHHCLDVRDLDEGDGRGGGNELYTFNAAALSGLDIFRFAFKLCSTRYLAIGDLLVQLKRSLASAFRRHALDHPFFLGFYNR